MESSHRREIGPLLVALLLSTCVALNHRPSGRRMPQQLSRRHRGQRRRLQMNMESPFPTGPTSAPVIVPTVSPTITPMPSVSAPPSRPPSNAPTAFDCTLCPPDNALMNEDTFLPGADNITCGELAVIAQNATNRNACNEFEKYQRACCLGLANCSLCDNPSDSPFNLDWIVPETVVEGALSCHEIWYRLYDLPNETACAKYVDPENGQFSLPAYCGCPDTSPSDECDNLLCDDGETKNLDLSPPETQLLCYDYAYNVLPYVDNPTYCNQFDEVALAGCCVGAELCPGLCGNGDATPLTLDRLLPYVATDITTCQEYAMAVYYDQNCTSRDATARNGIDVAGYCSCPNYDKAPSNQCDFCGAAEADSSYTQAAADQRLPGLDNFTCADARILAGFVTSDDICLQLQDTVADICCIVATVSPQPTPFPTVTTAPTEFDATLPPETEMPTFEDTVTPSMTSPSEPFSPSNGGAATSSSTAANVEWCVIVMVWLRGMLW